MMKVVVVFCFLTAMTMGQSQLQILLGSVSEKEGTGSVVVEILATRVNAALTVTVTTIYGQFSALLDPATLTDPATLLDPAEHKYYW